MEYDFLFSPRERLSLHIERLGKIVSAVYMLSPIEASHLLVAACMETCKLNEELDFYGAYDKTINILIEGFRHDKPILDENMEIIAKQIEILKNGAKQYYNAYSIERESGRSIYDEDKKTISKISRDSLESWMKREKECLTFIESITTHLSFKESPSCITPFPDVNSYHEYMWEMVCVLEKMIRDCMSKSRRIDELVSSPVPEMVSCYLRWKYQVFEEEVWPDSECKIKFDSAWKDNNSPSRNYNEKLAFLEEEKGKYLSSPNKKHATILWEILHINYNMDDGTCDFETAGDTIIGHWEKIRDAELKYVDEYAEKLIMASYIEGKIKRLKEEQEKNDEPKVKNDIKSADVVDLSKDDVKKDFQNGNRGRKAESLFDNPKTQSEYAELFSGFLTSRKTYAKVDTKKDNYINKAFVAFYLTCCAKGLVGKSVNGHACYRFLLNDCRLESGCDEKTYGGFIRTYVNEVTKRDTKVNEKYAEKILTIRAKIEDFMKNI